MQSSPMRFFLAALVVVAAPTASEAAQLHAEARTQANPIRKVVTMLQNMEKKVQAEGETGKELFDKFMCYCKSGKGDLGKSIADAGAKISSLPSDIEAAEEQLVQTKDALKKAQTDRASAKNAVAEATSMREKEAAAFASTKAEFEANLNAVGKAVGAIEKGMSGAFLQTGAAQLLERVTNSMKTMDEDHRDVILSFLSGERSQYAPASGEITGILKELGDDMGRSLSDATAAEEKQISIFNDLVAAKTKEINACTQAVEDKTMKIGELGIQIVEMKDDLTGTEKAFAEDSKFLADMDKNCAAKTAEWEVIVKTRGEELAAIADTIKMLNSDDALELFKKTVPSAGSSSFLQLGVSATEVRRQALAVLRGARGTASSRHRVGFDLIALGLTGRKVSFDKVLVMIDDMVGVLKGEQLDDDNKKEYCAMQFDLTDDKKKALARTISQETTSIDKAKEEIATLTDEIAALEAGLKALDRSVTEAGEQRKEENEAYVDMLSSNTAVKDLLGMAKTRLNKFYNPKLAFDQQQAAPGPAPEAPSYKKSGDESTGVIGMIDTMIADVQKTLTEGEAEEKEAQKDYESMTADAKEKRVVDMQSLEQKVAVKADTEVVLQDHTDAHKAASKEEMATLEYEHNLHTECDWLIQNFDMRRSAREGEIDSLKKAKDVLSGADYSLLQTHHLRRRA